MPFWGTTRGRGYAFLEVLSGYKPQKLKVICTADSENETVKNPG
jgi:hypothetical protein